MPFIVSEPRAMNETFARAFNSRKLENLLALYEPGARLRVDATEATLEGQVEIGAELERLLRVPGTMVSRTSFCIENDGLALLRADWALIDGDIVVASGSSAEVVRRQSDGTWLYVIDHAVGASILRVDT